MAGLPDFQQLMQLSQQVQGRLAELQSELAGRTFETTAGGGLVRVTADGRGTIRGLVIDPAAFEERDADFLAELVLSAVAEAQRRAGELLQSEMRKVQPFPFPLP
jgi:DNA-binding YbaB/EbfC family protein